MKKQPKDEDSVAPEVTGTDADRNPDAAAADTDAGTVRPDAEPDLAAQLAAAQDRLMRAKADLDNYRKRMQRELGEVREYVKIATLEEFLPVYDHFQMAMQHATEEADVKSLREGMAMIYAELGRTIESLGIETFDALGTPFDPRCHEAVAQEPSDKVPEGHVTKQWKCGFKVGDRIIRPATVVVSSGPAADNA